MASLANILENKLQVSADETNLVKGSIWNHTGSPMNDDTHSFCWESPGNGTAVIEVWGAGGTGSVECCCSVSVPGNPGAYSKRTVTVDSGSFVCGCTGCSYSGRSTDPGKGRASCVVVCHADGCNCFCVESGMGGCTICTTGTPAKCCFGNRGFPCRTFGSYCATICNFRNECADCIACAYGGEVNIKGGISCKTFGHCNACCHCDNSTHMQLPPGVISDEGGQVTVKSEMNNGYSNGPSGSLHANYGMALSTLSRNPVAGMQPAFCYDSARFCGCYSWDACRTYLPPAYPGVSGTSCDGIRSNGMRGGMGLVRITFIG